MGSRMFQGGVWLEHGWPKLWWLCITYRKKKLSKRVYEINGKNTKEQDVNT